MSIGSRVTFNRVLLIKCSYALHILLIPGSIRNTWEIGDGFSLVRVRPRRELFDWLELGVVLAIRDLERMTEALLGKWLWKFVVERDSSWRVVFESQCCYSRELRDFDVCGDHGSKFLVESNTFLLIRRVVVAGGAIEGEFSRLHRLAEDIGGLDGRISVSKRSVEFS